MNRIVCHGKGALQCYVRHYGFFLFSTTLFLLLLITAFYHAIAQQSVQYHSFDEYIIHMVSDADY